MEHWREEVADGGLTSRPSVFPKHELVLGRGDSLSALSGRFAFFTVAIPYVYGGMSDMLWFELSGELRHELPLFFWKGSVPMFSGLEVDGDADWNYAIWATEAMYWPVLEDYLLSAVFFDPFRGSACGFGSQSLTVVDAAAASWRLVGAAVPLVRVVSFGINGSDRRVAFSPTDASAGTPSVRCFPPDGNMLKFASAAAGGSLLARGTGPDEVEP